jgi:hypothetical protein
VELHKFRQLTSVSKSCAAAMQRNSKIGVLQKRFSTLRIFLIRRERDWNLRSQLAVAAEIRRLREQIELQNTMRCRIAMSSFNINVLSDEECLVKYRFTRNDIGFISKLIPWDSCLDHRGRMRTTRRRYRIDTVEATAILLRRLSTVSRWVDVEGEFGKHSACLAEIFYHTLELFHSKFGTLIRTWPVELLQARATEYAKCVSEKGSPLSGVIGFIDGTALEIARPSGSRQRATYSGHKRRNCVKFQVVSAPDGLILHVFGPVEGRRHDMTLYRESGIDSMLQSSMNIDGAQYCLYGDPAYCLRPYLQVGYQGSNLNPDQVHFNMSMSKVRIAVEWAFRDLKMYFTHMDFPRKLKMGVTPGGLWYICAAVLWNFRVCLYGNQTAKYFDCNPISIEEYLEDIPNNSML